MELAEATTRLSMLELVTLRGRGSYVRPSAMKLNMLVPAWSASFRGAMKGR